MDTLLTDDEIRVLGSLLEKERTTPDYYPLSLNGLINACNQKSNRNPVVSYDEETVLYALQGLQERKLVRQSGVSRVTKYEQIFSDSLNLVAKEVAVLCILFLRGPQTVGEIRGRTERMFAFSDLDEVMETIHTLEEMSFVKKLPRQPGRKESRFIHLLSGEPSEDITEPSVKQNSETVVIRKKDDRIEELEQQIVTLKEELSELRQQFYDFKTQFE